MTYARRLISVASATSDHASSQRSDSAAILVISGAICGPLSRMVAAIDAPEQTRFRTRLSNLGFSRRSSASSAPRMNKHTDGDGSSTGFSTLSLPMGTLEPIMCEAIPHPPVESSQHHCVAQLHAAFINGPGALH